MAPKTPSTPWLSIHLGNFMPDAPDSWQFLFDRAKAADAAGVDKLTVSDHVVFGENLEEYGRPEVGGVAGGKQPTGPDGQWLEPMTLMSVIAGIDNFFLGKRKFIEPHLRNPRFHFAEFDLLDKNELAKYFEEAKPDLVWHVAANSDISYGTSFTDFDLKGGTIVTYNVLEAMRRSGAKKLIFSSSGAVYGEPTIMPTPENYGPLFPISFYAASKVACESLITAFVHNFDMQAWIFRFGNIVGPNPTHGVIYDFIQKLRQNPEKLVIRGDGRQEKNYFLVEECIDGMAFAFRSIPMTDETPCDVFNLGTTTISRVVDIARLVRDGMGLADSLIEIEGTKKAWPGDQPRVHFTVDKIRALGWKARFTSDQAVDVAIRRMLGHLGPLEVGS